MGLIDQARKERNKNVKTYDKYTVATEHEGLTVETYLKQIVSARDVGSKN